MHIFGTTIPIASDHGGFVIKQFLADKLRSHGFEVVDFGTYGTHSVDYPDFIHPLARAVNDGVYSGGIILCGSGNGAQITANKYPGVRAGLCWNVEQAALTRQHNNANILSLPGRYLSMDEAWEITKTFLSTAFEGGRHQIRIDKIPLK